MITSESIYRSIYPQTGVFSFEFSPVLSNLTGALDFTLSGNGTLNYHFENGRILDNELRFVGVYDADQRVSLSGVVAPTTFDIYINGLPRAFGLPKSTGAFNAILVRPRGISVDFDLFVNGQKPDYAISSLTTFQTGSPATVTGYLTNLSTQPFQVFSGEYLGREGSFQLLSVPTGSISSSGAFTIQASGSGAGGLHSLPLAFYTNFGTISGTFPVSGIQTFTPSYSITLSGPSVISNDTSPGVYLCQFGDPNGGLAVIPSAVYLSGSGVRMGTVLASGNYTGSVTGLISGSGNLSALFTGFSSGLNLQGDLITGNLTTSIAQFFVATGAFDIPYAVFATGRVSGVGYTGLATGFLTGVHHTQITGSKEILLTLSGSPAEIEDEFDLGADTILISEDGSIFVTSFFTRSIAPTGYYPAQGAFLLSSPQEGDVFFVGDSQLPIAYPYSFNSAASFASYLNAHTGDHKVHATAVGSTVTITSLLSGASGNGWITRPDICNRGSSSFSSSILTSGEDLYAENFAQFGAFTGQFSTTAFATGSFSQPFTGVPTGLISGVKGTKSLERIWSLSTGSSSSLASMRPVSGSISGIFGSFYMAVGYSNVVDSGSDVLRLTISGINHPVSLIYDVTGITSF